MPLAQLHILYITASQQLYLQETEVSTPYETQDICINQGRGGIVFISTNS